MAGKGCSARRQFDRRVCRMANSGKLSPLSCDVDVASTERSDVTVLAPLSWLLPTWAEISSLMSPVWSPRDELDVSSSWHPQRAVGQRGGRRRLFDYGLLPGYIPSCAISL